MNQKAAQNAMNGLTHGVYVIGVHTQEKDNLMTAAWLCQISSSPAMLAVAVSKGHLTAELIERAGCFKVSVLKKDQKEAALVCGRVSGRAADKQKLVKTDYVEGTIPVIAGSAAWLKCRVAQSVAASDHILFLAQVEDGAGGAEDLLVYRKDNFF